MAKQSFYNKGISTPIGILIILVCALLLGGILFWQWSGLQKIKAPEIKTPEEILPPGPPEEELPEEIVPEIDTSTWKLYRNEKYGFEIQYPPELIAYETSPFREERQVAQWEGIALYFPTQDPPEIFEPYTFFASPIPIEPEVFECEVSSAESRKLTEKEVGGVTFVRAENKDLAKAEHRNIATVLFYIGQYKGVCYLFSYDHKRSGEESWVRLHDEINRNMTRFEQMISIFKFIE